MKGGRFSMKMCSYPIWHSFTCRSNFSLRRYHSLPTTMQTRIKTIGQLTLNSLVPFRNHTHTRTQQSHAHFFAMPLSSFVRFIMRHSKLFENFVRIVYQCWNHKCPFGTQYNHYLWCENTRKAIAWNSQFSSERNSTKRAT